MRTIVLMSAGPVLSHPEPVCRTQYPGSCCLTRVLDASHSNYLLGLHETLQGRAGSNLITTRRFTNQWQQQTLGVTQLLNEAWSRVSPC